MRFPGLGHRIRQGVRVPWARASKPRVSLAPSHLSASVRSETRSLQGQAAVHLCSPRALPSGTRHSRVGAGGLVLCNRAAGLSALTRTALPQAGQDPSAQAPSVPSPVSLPFPVHQAQASPGHRGSELHRTGHRALKAPLSPLRASSSFIHSLFLSQRNLCTVTSIPM